MRIFRTLITLCLCLASTQLFAQSAHHPLAKVQVPFSFVAGDQNFPAGEYLISTVQPQRTLLIAGTGSSLSSIQTVSPVYSVRPSENSRLVFTRYGNRYFLKEVWTEGSDEARTLPRSRHEMEVARAGAAPQLATVIQASSGR